MKRMNRTRNRVCCPQCLAQIKGLYYLSHRSISGEFTLATGHEDNLEPDHGGIEYSCPRCGEGLLEDEGSAEDFLLGKKVRPTLLEKKRAKPVEGT